MYVIFAPSYNYKSSGCKVLYELDYYLREYGQDSCIVNFEPRNYFGDRYNVVDLLEAVKLVKDNATVIYPEIVSGNPLNAKRIIRWILNAPLAQVKFNEGEITWAYDKFSAKWADNDHILSVPYVDLDICRDMGLKRKGSAFFVYKAEGRVPRIAELEETQITDLEPEDLYELLNSIKVLYTYDDYTGIADEARLCGCPVICLDFESQRKGFVRYVHPYDYYGYGYGLKELNHAKDTLHLFAKPYMEEFYVKFKIQLEQFIKETKEC
jgi:hypothetical protein